MTIVNGSNTTEIMDRQQVWGGTATAPINNTWYFFYLYPGLAEALTLQGTIRIPLYIEANTNFNANFRARIWVTDSSEIFSCMATATSAKGALTTATTDEMRFKAASELGLSDDL